MFRLETFDTYADDDALIEKWKSGKDILQEIEGCEWSRVLSRKIQEGVNCSRVHIVPDSLTDYLRFEIFGYYPVSSGLGESIYILPESRFKAAVSPLARTKQDFLLLDDRLYYHHYNENMLLEYTREINSPDLVQKAKEEMVALTAASLPLGEYLKAYCREGAIR